MREKNIKKTEKDEEIAKLRVKRVSIRANAEYIYIHRYTLLYNMTFSLSVFGRIATRERRERTTYYYYGRASLVARDDWSIHRMCSLLLVAFSILRTSSGMVHVQSWQIV